jgi:hypothetical protein
MSTRRKAVLFLSIFMILAVVADSKANLRVIINPWWPRAIILGPPLPFLPPDLPPGPLPPDLPPGPPPSDLPPAIGYVDLNVRPGDAVVTVDGVVRGKAHDLSGAPDLLSLVPGPHTLALSKEGFKTARFTIHIIPRRTIELDVTLDLLPNGKTGTEPTYQLDLNKTGFLSVQVEPKDASLYVDDSFYGMVSQFSNAESSIVLRAGSHKVEIMRPGYKPYSETVVITGDKAKEINVKLEKN